MAISSTPHKNYMKSGSPTILILHGVTALRLQLMNSRLQEAAPSGCGEFQPEQSTGSFYRDIIGFYRNIIGFYKDILGFYRDVCLQVLINK